MQHEKSLEFLQIAMKYLPEAKAELEKSGIKLSAESIQPFMNLFSTVMAEAYELGKSDAKSENE
ncbi:ComZ family protein [Bacillus atrophaeus]|uniref:Late competence protein n=1 Tax=Bacillus atrophaeus (strain 1942) TaxID=720555 RepID=A0ABM5LUV3_BACA1|nr:ComZ family protein [Bacillus atrophaeus]AMR63433.1 competence protein ComG [Bacillus subtilis subsp. globigii]ADP31613.1 putative late competence protein [Bacillus atrophaeus 1942]AIK48416.1 comZ family protein [Bacillus atrophaeus subsp. globigii]EIM10114.1 putative late competence protein [Bacillus atrophaeus C89]KFK83977.1 comZ family protein [Bacillus atrophaeus]